MYLKWCDYCGTDTHTTCECSRTRIAQNPYVNIRRKQSGFEDLPPELRCTHLEHNPPTGLYIPQGKQYRHVCPACGKEVVLRSI